MNKSHRGVLIQGWAVVVGKAKNCPLTFWRQASPNLVLDYAWTICDAINLCHDRFSSLSLLLMKTNTFVGHLCSIHIWVAGQCFPCVEIMM